MGSNSLCFFSYFRGKCSLSLDQFAAEGTYEYGLLIGEIGQLSIQLIVSSNVGIKRSSSIQNLKKNLSRFLHQKEKDKKDETPEPPLSQITHSRSHMTDLGSASGTGKLKRTLSEELLVETGLPKRRQRRRTKVEKAETELPGESKKVKKLRREKTCDEAITSPRRERRKKKVKGSEKESSTETNEDSTSPRRREKRDKTESPAVNRRERKKNSNTSKDEENETKKEESLNLAPRKERKTRNRTNSNSASSKDKEKEKENEKEKEKEKEKETEKEKEQEKVIVIDIEVPKEKEKPTVEEKNEEKEPEKTEPVDSSNTTDVPVSQTPKRRTVVLQPIGVSKKIFGTPLEEVLAQQQETHPNLNIPLFIDTAGKIIRDRGIYYFDIL